MANPKLPNRLPKTANEKLFDSYVRHQTGLIRYSGGIRNQVDPLFEEADIPLYDLIEKYAARSYGQPIASQKVGKILAEMVKEVAAARNKLWDQVDEKVIQELTNLAVQEAAWGITAIQGAVPVILGMTMPDVAHLRRVALATPFEGRLLKEWLATAKNADVARITRAAKLAIASGETPTQTARSIVGTAAQRKKDGITRKAFRDMETILLTVTNGIQNQAKEALYEENSDIIKDEYFVATLDSRTTLECASNDGKTFRRGEGPMPPLHMRCRSLRVPLIDINNLGTRGFNAATERMLVDEFAQKEGLAGSYGSRSALPRGTKTKYDTFARARGRELMGSIPAQTTYNEWLKTQPKVFQDQVLGPTRALMFRKGDIHLDKFVARDGDTLTLAELEQSGLEVPDLD